MKLVLFILSYFIFTMYLLLAALEDYRTCQVSRWKHLLGLVPAVLSLFLHIKKHTLTELLLILLFAVLFMLLGKIKVYGLADGFVLANLTLLFGSIGGITGIGTVIIVMLISCLFYLCGHLGKVISKRTRLFVNTASAFVPYIFLSYMVVTTMIITNASYL